MHRCAWATTELSISYHDQEWGVPLHDDQKLFELLILEGAQAGLSWETILNKREHYRQVFDQFDPLLIAEYGQAKIELLLADPGIIRNKRKILSAIQNAGVFLKIQKEFDSFDIYIWNFIKGMPINNHFSELSQLPSKTEISEIISKDLRKRGMNFIGPTIIYAYMQAIGLVNDHLIDCFRYKQIIDLNKNKK
ncbi:MAG: DNA-3-methyladenine glycosylase I [Anaerolineaceae bacterium]